MDWIGAFADGLADGLFWPFVALTVVAGFVGFGSFFYREDDKPAFGSPEYNNATWRIHVAVQGTVIMWLVWALLNAVPDPDYMVKTKVVERVKEVSVAATYDEAYKDCVDRVDRSQASGKASTSFATGGHWCWWVRRRAFARWSR